METKIMEEVISGKIDAYHHFIDEYKNPIFQLTLRLIQHEEMAKKYTKDILVKVYQQLPYIEGNISFLILEMVLAEVPAKTQVDDPWLCALKPREEVLERELHVLPDGRKRAYVLSYLNVGLSETDKANLCKMELTEYQEAIKLAKNSIRKYLHETIPKPLENCYELWQLQDYKDEKLSKDKRQEMIDHLEFCPPCRDVIKALESEEKIMNDLIHLPALNNDFNEEVMKGLTPYSAKKTAHRTWKFQLLIVGALIFIFGITFPLVQTIKPYTKLVGNYLAHGSFYNVWDEGSYAVTDNEITVDITSIEVDPIHMVITYKVDSDNKELMSRNGMDIVFVEAVDEDGKKHSMEFSPNYLEQMTQQGLHEETELYEQNRERKLYVKPLNSGSLPPEFTLHVKFRNVNGWAGVWNIKVPLQYEKGMEKTELVNVNETVVIDEKIEVEILTFEKGKHGSRIIYDIRLKEEEVDRIDRKLKQTDVHYDKAFLDSFHRITGGLTLVNNQNEYLVPIPYPSYSAFNKKSPYEMTFSTLTADWEYSDYKGEDSPDSTYSTEIRYLQYMEPGFHSFTVPLKEVENEPFEIDLGGYKTETLTVNRNEYGWLDVILSGRKTQYNLTRDFYWEYHDDTGTRIYPEDKAIYDDNGVEENVTFFNLSLVPQGPPSSSLFIQSGIILNNYIFKENEHRIPLN